MVGRHDSLRKLAAGILHGGRPDAVLLAIPWPDRALAFMEACADARIGGAAVFQLCSEEVELEPARRMGARRARAAGLRWVAVSRQNQSYLARTFAMSEQEIRLIYNGAAPADPRLLQGDARRALRVEVRSELGLGADAHLVITVGRLCQQKGYQLMLPFLQELCARFQDVHFLWAGEGEDEETLRAALGASGLDRRVHMLGFRDDVARLLAAADLFVLPSLAEGTPFALLEAMAHGCPVVASRAGGNGEVVVPGVDGLLVDVGDGPALQAALSEALLDRPRMRIMGQRGREATRRAGESMNAATLALLRAAAGRCGIA
jgi:glycosyltransferase involved in cell wall biosynthesis